jgi:hypothetical protein
VLTDAEGNGYTRDTRVYTGSGLREDKNPTSCVHRCIMIHWVETSSTPPFIGEGGLGFTREVRVDYNCIRPGLYLYLPILQDLSNDYL